MAERDKKILVLLGSEDELNEPQEQKLAERFCQHRCQLEFQRTRSAAQFSELFHQAEPVDGMIIMPPVAMLNERAQHQWSEPLKALANAGCMTIELHYKNVFALDHHQPIGATGIVVGLGIQGFDLAIEAICRAST